MDRLLQKTITISSSLVIAVGIGLTQISPSFGSLEEMQQAGSVEELIELRDRILQELETPTEDPPESPLFNNFFGENTVNADQNLLQQLKEIEVKILMEKRADDNWKQAINLATEAIESENYSTSLEEKKKVKGLWEQAIVNLNEIPETSLLASQASPKINQYESELISLSKELQIAESSFLEQIRQESGLSRTAMISVCNLYRDCTDLRGDQKPASAASLIKVPIAIALLKKTNQESVDLNQEIYVSGGNFTEDASEIRARTSYSLKKLMGEMIDHSSNIATNQLIDYVGQKDINNILSEQGFKTTRVKFKLMGDRIMPKNPGKGRNSLTSNELTEMMVKTYNYEYPSAEVLIEALSRQYDHEMGFDAVKDLEAQWLGEKTGQNSRVVGTTTAINIDGEPYIITVIDNHTGHIPQIRKSITKIVEHIAYNGHL